MSSRQAVDLYELLPTHYRLEDAEQGYPLRALLKLVAEQTDIVKRDIDGLWDDYFIETCRDWVVPYIGDLVANNPLYEVDQRRRPDVARTISYRRRKGTLPMLERLAHDVTGWGARAVAFFELLGWTQNLNHLRYQMDSDPEVPDAVDRVGSVNLRNVDVLDRLDSPFDVIAHSADVRTIRQTEGWHNIRKVGFFLWRLRRYALRGMSPRRAALPNAHGYHFSPLGNPAPLFNEPRPEAGGTGLAGEAHVPGPIRPVAFHFRPADYYGRSLQIVVDGAPVPLTDILCKDLRNWDPPPVGKVAVDVHRGRLAFAPGEEPGGIKVFYNHGFSANIGGGPYARRPRPGEPAPDSPDTVADPGALGTLIRVPADFGTIREALRVWKEEMDQPRAVIQIDDSDTYPEDLSIDMSGAELVVQAADRQRPTLLGDITVTGGTDQSRLALGGLLVEGGIEIQGNLGELDIEHCTLVPGRGLDEKGEPREPARPSITVQAANRRLRLEIGRSIVGPLRVPSDMVGLRVSDSIVDSPLRDSRARVIPALVSGAFSSVTLSSDEPAVNVTIGSDGPYRIVLGGGFGAGGARRRHSVVGARDLLRDAIRTAPRGPAFDNARVLTVPTDRKRLILLPGVAETATIEAAGEGDPTARELGLDRASSRQVYALVSGPLPPSVTLSSDEPAVNVTIGKEGPYAVVLPGPGPYTLVRLRELLQGAIRSAHYGPAFRNALVADREDRLVVLPGGEGTAVSFDATPTDRTTLKELALESDRPAIAASEGGELPGPPTTLERTTVFGAVHARELSLASEVIFTAPVTALRRQAGCVRFSYVPEGSRTPRRYRCQPDLALERRAREMSPAKLVEDLSPAEQDLVQLRLWPVFSSIRYGNPAYAQLGLAIAEEIRAGAEDGSEMGVFSHLQQPQREANLRLRLEEYLPFGLEAGFIFVT